MEISHRKPLYYRTSYCMAFLNLPGTQISNSDMFIFIKNKEQCTFHPKGNEDKAQ